MRLRILFWTTSFVCVAVALLAATGRLQVLAAGEDGQPLAGVRVTVTDAGTNKTIEKTTDERGGAILQGLQSGEVIVRFEREGYQTYETNAKIEAGTTDLVEATLRLLVQERSMSAGEKAAFEAVERYNQAVRDYNAGDLGAAEASLAGALERDPRLAPAHALVARIAAQRGQPGAAADAFLRARDLDPKLDVLPELIQALTGAGRGAEGAKLAAAARRSASSPGELYEMAIVEINRGNEIGARELLDQVLAAAPDHAPALYQRGLMRIQSGDVDGAKADFARYLELEPGGELAADANAMLEALGGSP